ncbi:conserved hypothetical protein (plasmid) [Shewanella baltica OS195]|uniref:Uncharacterized protein n=1 Tax=Shewanella baltica (strain OS195) TaxID=399599 RepID=A9L6Q2_SHEB9|nr:hypothetical protein [Shewanella baltica]ABX51834.1 conserved hypothetical protein [Shewanella baltica OS195]
MAKVVGIPFTEVKARLMENPDVVAAYQQAQHANESIQIIPVSQSGDAIMPISNIVSCSREGKHVYFSFVNLFGGHHYPVTMNFLPSGAVNVVVAGARYRCQANQVQLVIDESGLEHEGLACLKYLIEAGELNFHIPADVHEQLKVHPEFQKYSIIEWVDDDM